MNNINRSLLAVLMISLFSLASMTAIGSLVNNQNESVLGVSTVFQSLFDTVPTPTTKPYPTSFPQPTTAAINTNNIPCEEIARLQKQYCPVAVPNYPSPYPTNYHQKPAPASATSHPISCNNLYWFDNTHKNCSYKSFCGAFTYPGLRTFTTKEACTTTLNQAPSTPPQP